MDHLVIKNNIASEGALALGQTLRLAGLAVIKNLPSRRVWPTAKAPLATTPSLKTGCGILPCGNNKAELSMKAPMSVSKPVDLG